MYYLLGLPHSAQNLPVFSAPQEHFHLPLSAGFGLPHSEQNLPVFSAPQEHFQVLAGAGLGLPHSAKLA